MVINKKEISLFILNFLFFLIVDSRLPFGRFFFLFIIFYLVRIYLKRSFNIDNFSFFFRNKILVLSVVIISIGVLRNCDPNVSFFELCFRLFKFISFVFFVTYFTRSYIIQFLEDKNRILQLVVILVVPFLIFAILNLVLFFLDIKNENKFAYGNSVTLQSLGVYFERVSFYLVSGINSYGAVVGMFLSIMLTYLLLIRRYWLSYFSCFIFLLILLFTDTRAALFFSVLSFLITFLFYKEIIKIKYSKWLIYIMIVGPFLLILTLGMFGSESVLLRDGEDFQSGNSRLLIWIISLNDLAQFKWIHLFGYGEIGIQFSSSLNEFSKLLNTEDLYLLHPHNALIVSIVDNGYIGALIFIILMYSTLKKNEIGWKYHNKIQILILVFFIYNIFIGITETIYGLYYQSFYTAFYVFVILQFAISDALLFSNKTLK